MMRQFSTEELQTWFTNLAEADRHNIFCHCRACDWEWVDSCRTVNCPHCQSSNVETISCWQFPDD